MTESAHANVLNNDVRLVTIVYRPVTEEAKKKTTGLNSFILRHRTDRRNNNNNDETIRFRRRWGSRERVLQLHAVFTSEILQRF